MDNNNSNTKQSENKMKKLGSLFTTSLKIGAIGFGGGTALIPVIEEEVVEKKKLLNETDYNSQVVVASITPGALPVEIACGLGKKAGGRAGMVLSACGMAFPGVFMCILLLSLLSASSESVLTQISYAAVGIRAFIILLLTEYIIRILKESKKLKRVKQDVIIMLGVFILSGGKEIYQLLGISAKPLLDISTINILILAFFFIFYTRAKYTKKNLAISGVICLAYLVCVGKRAWIPEPICSYIKYGLWAIMLALGIWGLVKSIKACKQGVPFNWKELLKDEIVWIIFLIVLSIPAIIICAQAPEFLEKGFFSSVISFGGGDAYLTVAEGLFYENGWLNDQEFYSHLIPVDNILPGSILCKMLSGIGYFVGFHATENVAGGIIVALSGFACSVFGSCAVFMLIYHVYQSFEGLNIFKILKTWIRPIISGLLCTVALSLLYENFKTGAGLGYNSLIVLLVCVLIYGLAFFLRKKTKLNQLLIIIICAALSIGIGNLAVML